MTVVKQRFTQIHLLTSYPAANLNRDDTGRPKTVIYGGDQRLRISSQCLKRNWRVSDEFQQQLADNIGIRTRILGVKIYKELLDNGFKGNEKQETKAKEFAKKIAYTFAPQDETKKKKKNENTNSKKSEEDKQKEREKAIEKELTTQLVHISQQEKKLVDSLVAKKIANPEFDPEKEDLELPRKDNIDVDIALWGRMLASSPDMNIEAACQVAHAFSVNAVTIEDDYFTALDDLNDGSEDSGAGHVDDAGFGSGLFYSYICINNQLLLDNLGGNKELAKQTIRALIKAITTVTPSGKQNSFATRAYACYGLVEVGNQQPRSLAIAYLKSISCKDGNLAEQAITKLEQQRDKFNNVYGKCDEESANKSEDQPAGKSEDQPVTQSENKPDSFNAVAGTGKLEDVINKAAGVFA